MDEMTNTIWTNGIAHQRLIRDRRAEIEAKENLFGAYWHDIDTSIVNAVVCPISYETAKTVIDIYEWLGNMGTTEYSFGIYFDNVLAGVVCFGRTAGTNVYQSISGEQHAAKAITLCRGACVHWAHPHSATFLISRACKLMTQKGFHIFIAYADPDAGEIGTIYQALNWNYCGFTSPTEKFIAADGIIKDARLVHAYTRDRRNGALKYLRSRAEQKALMEAQGIEFFMGNPKRRYVGFYGPKNIVRQMKADYLLPTEPYPKRGNDYD